MPLSPFVNHLTSNKTWEQKRIGLFGGSFNPPHEGHLHIASNALKALHLDQVIWLVTPQNPLKPPHQPNTNNRLELCKKIIESNKKHLATDIEKPLKTKTSYETIKAFKQAFPKTHFVWIMGMDNADTFHLWANWQDILDELPLFIATRPPTGSFSKKSPLKYMSTQKHILINRPHKYKLSHKTCFWLTSGKTIKQSSTEIRNRPHALY